MTRDEIMQIANDTAGAYWMDEAHIQRFAAALLAAEREACAKVCEDYTDNGGGTFADHESHGYELAQRIRARGQK